MSERDVNDMIRAEMWNERPNGNWGGTLKEEVEANMILRLIRQKCLQHRTKCRYCPYWCKGSEECFFKKDFNGMELYMMYDSRSIL